MKKEAIMYIRQFDFPGESAEIKYISGFKYTCYDSFYPFWIFPDRGLETIDFEPITIFCGGNGSGKTTALNIIAEKLGLHRDSAFNRTSFFRDFTDMCRCRTFGAVPEHSCIITSDDVFDYMLDIRTLNEGIDIRREELFAEYTDARYSGFKLNSLEMCIRDRSGGIALLHSQFQIRDSLSFVGDENFYMIRIKINDSFPAAAVYKRIDLRLVHRYRYALDHSG